MISEDKKPFKITINFDITIPYERIQAFAKEKNVEDRYEELMENLEIRIPELIDDYIEKSTDYFLEEAYYDIK